MLFLHKVFQSGNIDREGFVINLVERSFGFLNWLNYFQVEFIESKSSTINSQVKARVTIQEIIHFAFQSLDY